MINHFNHAAILSALMLLPTQAGALEITAKNKNSESITEIFISYGISTRYIGPVTYIESFSNIYQGKKYNGVFLEEEIIRGYPELIVHKSRHDDELDLASLQRKIFLSYGYLENISGLYPPVAKIELFLIPCGYSYHLERRSISIRKRSTLTFSFPDDGGMDCIGENRDIDRFIFRTIVHESLHTILNRYHPNKLKNERAASTIEDCAELKVYGDARPIIRDEKVYEAFSNRGDALSVSIAARYKPDKEFEAAIPSSGSDPAGQMKSRYLFDLCKKRFKEAVVTGRHTK